MDGFEWDPRKAAANLAKHRVDFADAALSLEDPRALTSPDPDATGEERFVTIGIGIKERLLALSDQRITADGVVVIKAQTTRSQDQNRTDAVSRLQALVDSVAVPPKPRRATKPTKSSQRKRLQTKATRGDVKKSRGRVTGDN